MYNLITTGASYLFPGVRAMKLVKNGVNIANSINPWIVTKNVILTVLDCCAPPPLRLTAHCIGAVKSESTYSRFDYSFHFRDI